MTLMLDGKEVDAALFNVLFPPIKNPREHIRQMGEKLFGGPASTTLTRVADKRWTLTLDVGALQLTWTKPTRREVLAEAYGLLSRMAVGA